MPLNAAVSRPSQFQNGKKTPTVLHDSANENISSSELNEHRR